MFFLIGAKTEKVVTPHSLKIGNLRLHSSTQTT